MKDEANHAHKVKPAGSQPQLSLCSISAGGDGAGAGAQVPASLVNSADLLDQGSPTPVDQAYAAALLERLGKSKFRSSFSLRPADRDYFMKKGRAIICRHAHELLAARVGAADPQKDGKQTPYRGHPVFTAQHATATCCRGCIAKWHGIPKGRPLTPAELDRLVTLIMAWLDEQMTR